MTSSRVKTPWRFVCPNCESLDILIRTRTTPRYRCRSCNHEFAHRRDKKNETDTADAADAAEPSLSPGLLVSGLDACRPATRAVFAAVAREAPITSGGIESHTDYSRTSVWRGIRELRGIGVLRWDSPPDDGRRREYRLSADTSAALDVSGALDVLDAPEPIGGRRRADADRTDDDNHD